MHGNFQSYVKNESMTALQDAAEVKGGGKVKTNRLSVNTAFFKDCKRRERVKKKTSRVKTNYVHSFYVSFSLLFSHLNVCISKS